MPGLIPQSFIDDLLNRVDIVDVIDARVPLKKQGSNWVACCPFHDEKTPSFSVSPTKQFYYCFGCGASGTAIGFLMEYDRLGFVEAVETLAGSLGIEVPREGAIAGADSHDEVYRVIARADAFYRERLRRTPTAVAYLKQRGLSGATAGHFGLGWAPDEWTALFDHIGGDEHDVLLRAGLLKRNEDSDRVYDRFRGRIMFPIRDRRGRTIAFGGRVVDGDGPKYLNSPETPVFHKGRELYGLYEARKARRNLSRLLVVEGYMDVIMLAEHGIDYAVATLGTSAGETHVERLFAASPEVVFCFDGDEAGRQAAWRALTNTLRVLTDGREARFLFLPEGEDPDSMVRNEGAEVFERRVVSARPLADFLIEHVKAGIDTTTVGGRAQLAAEAGPLLARMPRGVYHDLLLEHLAAEVGLTAERLRADLATGDPRPGGPGRRVAASSPARSAVRKNPMRTVIALLVQHPGLARHLTGDHPVLSAGDAGARLLQALRRQIDEHPRATTAQLLEAFRDTSDHVALTRLAGWEFATDPEFDREDALAREFDDALSRLAEQQRRARYATLVTAAHERALTADEKREIQSLLGKA